MNNSKEIGRYEISPVDDNNVYLGIIADKGKIECILPVEIAVRIRDDLTKAIKEIGSRKKKKGK